MSHPKCECLIPAPDLSTRPYDQSKFSSICGVKLKYEELSSGLCVRNLVTPISPRKDDLFDIPDLEFTSEILVGEEVSILALAPFPVYVLIKVQFGKVRLCHYLRQDFDVELLLLSHEILSSDELVPIYFLTEAITIESISKFAILTIAAFRHF